ncbi:MAG: DUF1700 domain-containing protein [Ruminiclostridium sp.]|nr:DUF1700 domain-containing protein [Ruminiclostridium sp.]MBQ9933204.1 DUF1700 domain-containing protein [Ruminiclostridium sp.]
MNKKAFLWALMDGLSGLPMEDIERSLDYYSEMIDDRMEDGLSEEEAVAAMGPVKEICAQILAETPLSRLVKEAVRPKRKLRVWEIVLLVLGSPVWVPLVAAAVIVVVSVYLSVWAVLLSLYAADLAVAVTGLAGGVALVQMLMAGRTAEGILFLGGGLVCIGLAILLFFGFNQVTKGLVWVTKQALLALKNSFVRKGAAA